MYVCIFMCVYIYTPGKGPVPILQEAGWVPGPVWTVGKSCPHRDSIPDRQARSQSLYRLSYLAHTPTHTHTLIHTHSHTHSHTHTHTHTLTHTHSHTHTHTQLLQKISQGMVTPTQEEQHHSDVFANRITK